MSKVFDGPGIPGMFGMIAVMYLIFAVSLFTVPETFGKSMENIEVPV